MMQNSDDHNPVSIELIEHAISAVHQAANIIAVIGSIRSRLRKVAQPFEDAAKACAKDVCYAWAKIVEPVVVYRGKIISGSA
jgi:hypothetical protein